MELFVTRATTASMKVTNFYAATLLSNW